MAFDDDLVALQSLGILGAGGEGLGGQESGLGGHPRILQGRGGLERGECRVSLVELLLHLRQLEQGPARNGPSISAACLSSDSAAWAFSRRW